MPKAHSFPTMRSFLEVYTSSLSCVLLLPAPHHRLMVSREGFVGVLVPSCFGKRCLAKRYPRIPMDFLQGGPLWAAILRDST